MTKRLLSAAIAMALAGCGGSGSGSSEVTAPTYTVAGALTSDAIPQDARVCADLNQNLLCDQGEPGVEAVKGDFSITSENKAVLTSTLVAQFDHQGKKVSVMAPARKLEAGNQINGITSLLVGLLNQGMTLTDATALLVGEMTRAGIVPPASLLDNSNDASLATLDRNVVDLLKQLTGDNREAVVSALGLSLADYPVLVQENPEEQALAALITPLSQLPNDQRALNDTGVVRFFSDSSSSEDVAQSQPDYPGQDGDYGLDVTDRKAGSGKGFDFVKLDDKGNALADDATEWRCIQDKRSGLVWESKSADAASAQYKGRLFALALPGVMAPFSEDLNMVKSQDGAPFSDGLYTTEQYIAHINKQALCGISQWRLPTGLEFYDLLDLGETAKEGDAVLGLTLKYFPNQGLGSPYMEQGAVWTDSLSYNAYSQYMPGGSMQYNLVSSRGDYRGHIESLEIYTDKSESDYDSYQFPIRLVANKE